MRVVRLILLVLLLSPGVGSSQEGTTAFVGVNVLPMDREKVLEDHTVLIQGGVIQEVAPSYRVSVPEGARIIDGTGLFLAPGLADMHVTLPSSQATSEQVEDFMFLLLANNVTVIRGMDGASNHLQIKRQIADGTLLGPTVWAGAPPLNGGNAPDGSAAIERMMAHRRAGYDFQPIAGGLTPQVWDSLSEEAHSRGYTFGGNIPSEVGLRAALSSGISFVEHLDGYLKEVVSDEVRSRLDRGEAVPLVTQLQTVEGRKMRAVAAHTRSSDSWVIPTLYLWEKRYGSPDVDSLLTLPEMRWVPSFISDGWILEAGGSGDVPPETGDLMVQVRQRILRALTMAGVGVLMGTDSPRMFNVPGFALRHELRSMAAAGLTPYEIMVTGTRNVSDYARNELLEPANFGTVVEGNRADLILLRANPLEDLEALWDQEGVMIRGEWIPRERIDGKLASMAETIGG
jgi:imidazolonepropionase-like amidohydrolase